MDYFAANDLAAFSVISGTPSETTNGSFIDTTYTAKGIIPNSGIVQSAPFMNPTTGVTTSLTDLWFHMDHFTANNGAQSSLVEFVDSSGTSVVRLGCTAAGVYRIDYWNGSAWVNGAATFNIGSTRATFDIHIVCGLSGSLNVYFNGTLGLTTTGLNAAVDNVQSFKLFGPQNLTYSQLLVSDQNTIGCKVADIKPTGAGTNSAWTGLYTDVVETGFNDTTMISDSVLGDKVSYACADITIPNGYTISTVWYAIRARQNSASPQNIKPLFYFSGVAYAGAYNFPNLNTVSFGPSIACIPTDPSGGSWNGVTNINAGEFGLQVAA